MPTSNSTDLDSSQSTELLEEDEEDDLLILAASEFSDLGRGPKKTLDAALKDWGAPQIAVEPEVCAPCEETTRLSAQADVFMPSSSSLASRQKLNKRARKFRARARWHCREALDAAEAALSYYSLFASVEFKFEKTGVSLHLLIRNETPDAKERALELAQQALLSAAEQSKEVYVLGYRNAPFMATPEGFCCVLGTAADMRHFCWEYFINGWCARGDDCAWQHPAMRLSVNVVAKMILET